MLAVYDDDGKVDEVEMYHRGARVAWIRLKGDANPIATVFAQGKKFAEDDPPEAEEPDPRSKKRVKVDSTPGAIRKKPVMTGDIVSLDRPHDGGEDGLDSKAAFDPNLKMFWLIPLLKVFRIGIFGITGTGKSKFAADQPMLAYNMLYPTRNIVIVSFFDRKHEPAYSKLKNVRYISLDDESLAEQHLTPENYKDTLMVFDDIESIVEKDLLKQIMRFRDTCLIAGRKYGVSTISICHEIHDREKTRTVHNECDEIVLFNQGNGNVAPIKKLLAEKFGLSKSDVEFVLSSQSRWVAVKKSYPKVIISPSTIRLIP